MIKEKVYRQLVFSINDVIMPYAKISKIIHQQSARFYEKFNDLEPGESKTYDFDNKDKTGKITVKCFRIC